MSKRDIELFLLDILVAILKIKHYTKDFRDARSLKYDFKSWDAVIREFEIIGEATNNLIKYDYFSNDKREIVDFRNILIHEYFGIDETEVWGIIKSFLDSYQSAIEEEIHNIEEPHKKKLITAILDENRHIDFIVQKLSELTNE